MHENILSQLFKPRAKIAVGAIGIQDMPARAMIHRVTQILNLPVT